MPWFRNPNESSSVEQLGAQRMELAIQSLPEHLQAVVRMRRYEGLTVPQSAERLNLSERDTLRKLARAMALITMHLGEQHRVAQAAKGTLPFP